MPCCRTSLPAAVLGGLTLLSVGCVERTLTIRSAPDGALVHLNQREVGRTPLTVDFTWYGDYDVVLRKDGYQTLTTHRRIHAPWYQWPGIDFVTECLIPATITDHQEIAFELQPAEPVRRAELLQRSEAFRQQALFEKD